MKFRACHAVTGSTQPGITLLYVLYDLQGPRGHLTCLHAAMGDVEAVPYAERDSYSYWLRESVHRPSPALLGLRNLIP